MFEMIHICDYCYRDYSGRRKINLKLDKFISPVYFHHNDYWIVDGFDFARIIAQLTSTHRKDWRKVINGKWRLQSDWAYEWYKEQRKKRDEE